VLRAVTKIVFEVETFGFYYVESLVLDLPTGPTVGGEFGDIVGTDGKIGDAQLLERDRE
jgi:hypothetical protein